MTSEHSPYDSARFGFTIHRARCDTPESVDAAAASAQAAGAELLILRFPTRCLEVATHLGQRGGYILGDVLVHYGRELSAPLEVHSNAGYSVRLAEAADRARVEATATACFRRYDNHYRADPRTADPESVAVGYGEWAARFCGLDDSFCVLIEAEDGALAAFAGCEERGGVGYAMLTAVDPSHQRRRLLRRLLEESLNTFVARGATSAEISTQVHNTAAQKVWTDCGFEIRRAEYTVHLDLRGE